MDEIAKESQLTKRTVYQYFNSKEDIFYAVALKGTNDYILIVRKHLKLEGMHLISSVLLTRHIINSISIIMNYQPDNKQNCEASPYYQELGAFKNRIVQLYIDIVEDGQYDSSINAKLNPKYAAYFGLLSSVGMLNLVS